ncbi:MAG: SUMF1/EgtB/PvdO family nonheme iron enzyme [Myxococcota bacterium]|nr:SUMF1/EgtB/PvdO family nonheme iron enzyme [Myxococcota bacterium]
MKQIWSAFLLCIGIGVTGCFEADGGQLSALNSADIGAEQCGVERPCEVGSICHPTGVCIQCPGGRCAADGSVPDAGSRDLSLADSASLADAEYRPDTAIAPIDASIATDGSAADLGPLTDGSNPDSTVCIPTNEACNANDDDCDGRIDEDFDLNGDLDHCGACNEPCSNRPNAIVDCIAAECVIERCQPGYFDSDQIAENGCETAQASLEFIQPQSNESIAGQFSVVLASQGIDALNTIELRGNGALLARRAPSARLELLIEENEINEGPLLLTASVLDRDGLEIARVERMIRIDQTPPELNVLQPIAPILDQPAPFLLILSVTDQSTPIRVTVGRDAEPIAELFAPPYEVLLDPENLGAGRHVIQLMAQDAAGNTATAEHIIELSFCRMDTMVPIPGQNFEIDRYEASRPDATDVSGGADGRISCSQLGVQPWSGIDYFDASEICERSGKRLCSSSEWLNACEGIARRLFPYDGPYDGQSCNGQDLEPFDGPLPTGFMDDCATAEGVMDMSGNLAEWTQENLLGTGVAGGDFRSQRQELQCDGRREYESAIIRQTHGFRCCRDLD